MANVTQSYIDGILEGRAAWRAIGGRNASAEDIRAMAQSVESLQARSRELAHSATAGFAEFMRGEAEFWRNQVAILAA